MSQANNKQVRHKGESNASQKNLEGGLPIAIGCNSSSANRGVVVFASLLDQQEKNLHKQQLWGGNHLDELQREMFFTNRLVQKELVLPRQPDCHHH